MESEYIAATNLAKIRAAQSLLRDALPGYGLSATDYSKILRKLVEAENRLSKAVQIQIVDGD